MQIEVYRYILINEVCSSFIHQHRLTGNFSNLQNLSHHLYISMTYSLIFIFLCSYIIYSLSVPYSSIQPTQLMKIKKLASHCDSSQLIYNLQFFKSNWLISAIFNSVSYIIFQSSSTSKKHLIILGKSTRFFKNYHFSI